jgi:hypothetical protein
MDQCDHEGLTGTNKKVTFSVKNNKYDFKIEILFKTSNSNKMNL